jgi:hypothetical protein
VNTVKALISALLVSCALAAPAATFAQSTGSVDNNGPLTRAQVQADLARVEQAGYRPWLRDINYPNDIQHAEATVAQQDAKPGAGAVGGATMTGTSDAGSPTVAGVEGRSLYAGH